MALASQDSALTTPLVLAGRLRASEAERERILKRVGAGVAVAIVHALILLLLLTANHYGAFASREKKEVILLLPPLNPTSKTAGPPVPLPPSSQETIPRYNTITIPAPPPSTAQKPGDVLEAIGKELACGAGPWEHLTQAEREACKRNPWHYKKNAKGVIVLDVPSSSPPPDDSISGIDAVTQGIRTSDPCLAAGNSHTECIHKNIFGR
jgi:hypothetical protein